MLRVFRYIIKRRQSHACYSLIYKTRVVIIWYYSDRGDIYFNHGNYSIRICKNDFQDLLHMWVVKYYLKI